MQKEHTAEFWTLSNCLIEETGSKLVPLKTCRSHSKHFWSEKLTQLNHRMKKASKNNRIRMTEKAELAFQEQKQIQFLQATFLEERHIGRANLDESFYRQVKEEVRKMIGNMNEGKIMGRLWVQPKSYVD